MNKLPGEQIAKNLGYNLSYHSGNESSATYTKNKFILTVRDNNTAKLESIYKLVTISTGSFAFPHQRFEMFEKMILECIPYGLENE